MEFETPRYYLSPNPSYRNTDEAKEKPFSGHKSRKQKEKKNSPKPHHTGSNTPHNHTLEREK